MREGKELHRMMGGGRRRRGEGAYLSRPGPQFGSREFELEPHVFQS
jgi:hypothetical protein